MTDYQNLSESELQKLIHEANVALQQKNENKRKKVIAQIKELAASIEVIVDIKELDNTKVSKAIKQVPVKYRHPEDPDKTWTGRGVMPKWLQALTNEGRNRQEFEV